MAYESVFDRVNWEDEPSAATPVNQNNLNKSDSALKIIDGRVVAMDSRLTQLEGYEPRVMGYAQDAENSKENSEAYAIGTINGVDVTSSSLAYHNNSKWYSEQAGTAAAGAATSKQDSEAYAVGKVNGVDVTSSHFAFHNNAKWYSEQASGSATSASTSAGSASDSASDAEAYSAGTRQSSPVSSDDPAYHNNAKYYLEQAVAAATSAANSKDAAFLSEGHAHSSEIAAASSAYKASISATSAASSEHNASVSEGNAAISAASASSFASTADNRAVDSEAWAVGKRRGQDVSQSDETYHNNAKYWADQASQAAGGGVTSFNGRSQAVEPMEGDYTASMVGLGNVDNTSDLNKPLSYAMSSALALKTPKSDIAPTEESPSTHAYKQGDIFYYNGVLYKAKTAIAVDDVLTVGTNIETTTISATSGGHVIVDESGSLLAQRDKLQFMNCDTEDDSTNGKTVVTMEKIQRTSLPTASATELGHIYQYIGTTSQDYVRGYFYECVYENSTYSWKNVSVSEGGGTTIITKPTVSVGTYTYNGSAQGPTITWAQASDADNCIITNGTKTDAGTYTLTIALKNTQKMLWYDETTHALTTADLTYSYSIAKANQTITLSSNSVTLDPNNLTATVTVSGAQGSILATTSDNTIATASVSGSTVTISNVSMTTGSATITVTAAATTNYNSDSDIVAVTTSFIPNGSTVTPTDDIQTWLNCGGIFDKNYTTLNQVLSDASTLSALISDSNAVDYMVRSTTWATDTCNNQTAMSYIGLNNYCSNTLLDDSTWLNAICNSTYFESILNVKVPTMTSNTTPSGVVSASSIYDSRFEPYHVFADDGVAWTNAAQQSLKDNWLQYKFTNTTKVNKIWILPGWDTSDPAGASSGVSSFKVQGSNDGSSYTDLGSATLENRDYSLIGGYYLHFGNNTSYLYYRVYFTGSGYYSRENGRGVVKRLQFYGR